MEKMFRAVMRFVKDEEGAVAIEYGLLAVLIALAIAVGASILGGGLNTLFTDIAACFGGGTGTCPVTMPAPLTP